MPEYIVNWNRNDYGYIKIKANSEDEARELFESGEWDEKDLFIKNGGMDVDGVEPAEKQCETCGKLTEVLTRDLKCEKCDKIVA